MGDLMYRTIVSILLGSCVTAALAADQSPNSAVDHWTAAELHGYEKSLHQAVSGPGKNATHQLTHYDVSSTLIAHREADGVVEVHAKLDDYFVVQSGAATLVTGGDVVNPKSTDPDETRGDSIKGGERLSLGVGDIVHIPAGVPHWLLVSSGKEFTYFVIKVKSH
jgi:mannose-6-phosphate isomerase-like protein (cupin superfamily)